MLLLTIFTAIVLLVMIILVVFRALDYIGHHPEIINSGSPLTYQHCHLTLNHIIARYKEIKEQAATQPAQTWHSPRGRLYMLTDHGIEERRTEQQLIRQLPWPDIGGVGLRMQPGFQLTDDNGDGWPESQYTTGYSFHLLIVPTNGDTIDVQIPTDGQQDAIRFVAQTIVLAEHKGKRINIFGFDKPPAPYRQRISKI